MSVFGSFTELKLDYTAGRQKQRKTHSSRPKSIQIDQSGHFMQLELNANLFYKVACAIIFFSTNQYRHAELKKITCIVIMNNAESATMSPSSGQRGAQQHQISS